MAERKPDFQDKVLIPIEKTYLLIRSTFPVLIYAYRLLSGIIVS
ncbi:hypothetical protein ASAP_2892 [Asaia bogorensis]|uniref:Uncharacterized protein n=1 Tax=Asaia bogorensis TaxID=91915 RepID=A0A060QM55_9PROT|nr:hypothetical protein P792_13000 [Asaia sp. SF2.1]CDG40937.1 hypothetical protein ASAP_2892 [Asaia bogorensis]